MIRIVLVFIIKFSTIWWFFVPELNPKIFAIIILNFPCGILLPLPLNLLVNFITIALLSLCLRTVQDWRYSITINGLSPSSRTTTTTTNLDTKKKEPFIVDVEWRENVTYKFNLYTISIISIYSTFWILILFSCMKIVNVSTLSYSTVDSKVGPTEVIAKVHLILHVCTRNLTKGW